MNSLPLLIGNYKRNYLSGYLSGLKDLERKGKVKIIDIKRNGIVSLFI